MDGDLLRQKLMDSAIRFVSFRPRSEKEMVLFLTKKMNTWNCRDPDILPRIIERLKELEYIDDRKFVEWWISQRQTHNLKGFRAIYLELMRKGIQRELIQEIVKNSQFISGRKKIDTFQNDREVAGVAVEKKLAVWQHLPKIELRKKLYSFLLRRGFSTETAVSIIDERIGKDYNRQDY